MQNPRLSRNFIKSAMLLYALNHGMRNIFKKGVKFMFPDLPPKVVDPQIRAKRRLRKAQRRLERIQRRYAVQTAHECRIQRMKAARRARHAEISYV